MNGEKAKSGDVGTWLWEAKCASPIRGSLLQDTQRIMVAASVMEAK